ncbi:hypothetical protein SAMN04488007_1862 [Maribacter aquivivus]|uniref:Uncharacterized protein n=1 Tax=Maribacter aquivivus TaxID=228958 RepID=A0A1M6N204_9FLAO|nr:hypothetical protein SAMN04488007_1862 [Maribacter aquivivus]
MSFDMGVFFDDYFLRVMKLPKSKMIFTIIKTKNTVKNVVINTWYKVGEPCLFNQ